jgi:hypothetical protein
MPPPPALHCAPCISRNLKCKGAPGRRCAQCNVSKRTCNFCKCLYYISRFLVCTDICIARPKKGLPKCTTGETSVKETTSSVAVNNDGAFEGFDMEVEVFKGAPGETSPSAKGSASKCALSPTESAPPFKGKGKAKDTEEELEDVEEENACLREENVHLRPSVLGMRQYAHTQQADMLALSNKLFNMSQEWADFEKCANAALR